MEFSDLISRARAVQEKYRQFNTETGKKKWGAAEYVQGFMGDVGDLAKLVMANQGYRDIEGVNEKIKHELADCLWSILTLSQELGVDLEAVFIQTMKDIEKRITK